MREIATHLFQNVVEEDFIRKMLPIWSRAEFWEGNLADSECALILALTRYPSLRFDNLPRDALRRAHQRRARDRRGVDQGLHLSDPLSHHVRARHGRRPHLVPGRNIFL